MFQRLRKWFALRSYAMKLSAKLRERYGVAGKYSPKQVTLTVDKCGFNKEWIRYAFCMFCDYADLAQSDVSFASDYAVLRTEVANRFLKGQAIFTAEDFGEDADTALTTNNDCPDRI